MQHSYEIWIYSFALDGKNKLALKAFLEFIQGKKKGLEGVLFATHGFPKVLGINGKILRFAWTSVAIYFNWGLQAASNFLKWQFKKKISF